ncbi:stalk domain-containing protein [Cohnella fermenti]|uniref:Copper amine oxidase N-terminal domain-containing protein n=1 Tax=Cohnella fermenti TaxID=2565925 RepID=A0A4S4BZJ3_9BACL|nr:copper amine oxidase N-terminal domain-containing protein [Cohnella fermenti]THF80727.1 copper amine oxidase N-terminal domain-containing protein [Cohnella fermenti]
MTALKKIATLFPILLSLALLLGLTAPALAADADSASAGGGITIKLKVGSTEMTVNGSPITITAPFQKDGTTFVPLSVITKSFGATLQLKDNKVITLGYLSHKVVLTIGSKTVWVDGVKSTLVSAPVVVKGVTMVPLRVVEAFGAKVTPNFATKEIVITVATAASSGSSGSSGVSGIDSDAGKTKIGDSYYGWTMNYPTGLVKSYQSSNGDSLEFRDVSKDYYLAILVEDETNELSASEIRETIETYFFEKEALMSFEPATQTGKAYSKAVSKDSSTGYFYQYRSYLANDRLYTIVFGKKTTSAADLEKEAGILDSFKTSFDPKDTKVKDLTAVKDGQISFAHEEFGMSVKLPVDWWQDEDEVSYPSYYSADQDAYLYTKVTSLVSGDTLEKWADRRMERLKQLFNTPYFKEIERKNVTWNGQPAIILKISYSNDTKTWSDEYQLFSLTGKHRFYAEYSYSQSKKDIYEPMADRILNSIRIDSDAIEDNIGYIEDTTDLFDATATTTKTSKKYGYSLALPRHWTGISKDFESDFVQYSDFGSSFALGIIEQPSASVSQIAQIYMQQQQQQESVTGFKQLEYGSTTVAGQSATRIVYEMELSGVPYRNTVTVFEHGGNVYILLTAYNVASGTAYTIDLLNKVVQSFAFQ